MNPMPNRARAALGAVLLLSLACCATHLADLAPVQEALVAGDIPTALTRFDQVKGSRKDLLYLLERGYMSHLGGRWEESNRWFEAAERRALDRERMDEETLEAHVGSNDERSRVAYAGRRRSTLRTSAGRLRRVTASPRV